MPRTTTTRQIARQMTGATDLAAFIEANRGRFDADTVAGLKEEVDRLVKVDLTEAEPLALATKSLAEALGDPVSLGFGEATVAEFYHYAGRLSDAEALYHSAIERLRTGNRRKDAAAIERQLVALHHRQGRAKDALAVARRARRTLARAGEKRLLAQLENNVGAVYYYSLERYTTALKHYQRAYDLLVDGGDDGSLSLVEFNRASVLIELDQPFEAIDLYTKAENLHKEAGRKRFAVQCSYMIAYAHAMLGRYGEALRRFYAAREKFQELGDRRSYAWASVYLSELHVRLNVIDEAIDLATTAYEEFSILEGHEAEMARALLTRARAYERRRDFDSASAEMQQAQKIYDDHGMAVLAADARLAQAELAIARRDHVQAEELAAEAIDVYRRSRLPRRRNRANMVRALAARLRGDRGRGLRLARAVLRATERRPDPWLECQAAMLIGDLEIDRGRTADGIASYERAVDGIERLRLRLRPGEARAAFLAGNLTAYEQLVQIHLDRGDATSLRTAFRYVEMAKSRALADLMTQHLQSTKPGGPSSETRVRERLAQRLEELNWYTSRVDQEFDKGDQRNVRLDTQLRSEISRCERDLASLFRRLEVEDEHLAGLLSAQTSELDDLAADLADDEAAVEFFITGNRISAFVVTRDSHTAHASLADLDHVDRHVTGLRYQFEKFGLGDRYTGEYRAALRRSADSHLEALYSALLKPIANEIEGRRLLIIPHGLLHYVPFHALKRPDGRYVVEDHQVSYAPSATVHRLCARRQTGSAFDGGLLALGLGDQRTPHITSELTGIRGFFDQAVVLEGLEANKAAFLQNAPQSRFLHLATHGYFRQDNPMFSSVRLVDGPLNFYDVFDLDLNTELVTLSACNTGINRLAPGDELCGLMRGFLYAGAPSLLVSLWSVNDRSTSELMQSFYGHLHAGLDKRDALRRAELEALERYGHPYYWAPFILMGKTSNRYDS